MQFNPYGIITFLIYTLLPIAITYLLAQIFTQGKPVQRKGWKNWFLLLISIATGALLAGISVILGKTFNNTNTVLTSSFMEYFLIPSALVIAAVTLSLKGSRYIPSVIIPPTAILLTSLIPSSIEILKSEQTYEGTLPMYMPLVIFILLPTTFLACTIANFAYAKLTPKKTITKKES